MQSIDNLVIDQILTFLPCAHIQTQTLIGIVCYRYANGIIKPLICLPYSKYNTRNMGEQCCNENLYTHK